MDHMTKEENFFDKAEAELFQKKKNLKCMSNSNLL